MSTIYIGSENGMSLILQAGYPTKTRDENGYWQIEYLYACRTTVAESLVPAYYAQLSGPHSDLRCLGITIRPLGGAHKDFSSVTVVYKVPTSNTSASTPSGGEIVKETTSTYREVPLDSAESKNILTQDQIDAKKAKKFETVGIASPVYTYTEYLAGYNWTEVNVVYGLNSTGTPIGLSGANELHWKMVEFTVREEGEVIERRRSYQYNAVGWA